MVPSNIKEQSIDTIATWVNLENIRLSERCLTQVSTYYINLLTCFIYMEQARVIYDRNKIPTKSMIETKFQQWLPEFGGMSPESKGLSGMMVMV